MKHLYKLSLLLLAFLLPATALAHDFEVDGIYYNINGNEATVTYRGSYGQYNEYSGSVSIPSTVTYNGTTYSVTSIDIHAFSGCNSLTSIDIPNSVTSIGDYAFINCFSLTRIVVASGNPTYDSRNNSNAIIETATNTLITGCMNTVISNSITAIGGDAFYGCSSLTNITIPNSVTTIGDGAFQGCSGLTSVTIPKSVTSIGNWAFSSCTGLTNITVVSGNLNYDSRNNCNAIIETASNILITGCMNTFIPNSVTSIGEDAFFGCTGLTSINIPNSVTTIDDFAFNGCSRLTSIDIPNSVLSIGYGAFLWCTRLISITIPNSITTIGGDAFNGTAWYNNQPDGLVYAGLVAYKYKGTMPSGTSITLRDGTLGIANGAFSKCYGLTSITIPNSVTTIGNYAFDYCSALTSITIPNSVTTIGDAAFRNCTGLTSITIPNSVTTIGNSAFSSCASLTSIDIPNSVTSIGDWAFYGCSSLTEIYSLALTPPTIASRTFYKCYGATLYVPKETVNAYKATNYWKNFTNIVGVIIPGTSLEVNGIYYLVTDENSVFVTANENVDSYYSGDVVIPDSVTYEGYTFAVTGIEDNAFDGCFELTSITIPNSVETIGEQAFQGCTGLTSVTIGSGVTSIGAKAFNYCNALETVKCLGTVPPVMASTDCFSTAAYNRATLLVPRNTEATYTAADYWYKFAHIDGWGSAGRGDIDGDGEVSIRDVTGMIDAILTGDYEGVYVESADLNNNGRLDIGDVTTIIDMLLNDIR